MGNNDDLELEEKVIGSANSQCKSSDKGKATGVLYQQGPTVRAHNGKIIGCDHGGYIVKHCYDASHSPFKFNTFYFYTEKYFHSHTIPHSHAHAFLDIRIRNTTHAIWFYAIRQGEKHHTTHNGVFHSFTYTDPATHQPKSSSDWNLFMSFTTSPHSIRSIVYYHYVEQYSAAIHGVTLHYERATASSVLHYGAIPSK